MVRLESELVVELDSRADAALVAVSLLSQGYSVRGAEDKDDVQVRTALILAARELERNFRGGLDDER